MTNSNDLEYRIVRATLWISSRQDESPAFKTLFYMVRNPESPELLVYAVGIIEKNMEVTSGSR